MIVMTTVRRVVMLLAVAAAARQAHAQQRDALTAGIRAPASSETPQLSDRRLVLVSVVGAFAVAGVAFPYGIEIDESYCRRHELERDSFTFERCMSQRTKATNMAWIGGSVAGATLGATLVARRRGCPGPQAFWRSFGGAVLGAVPGAVGLAGAGRDRPAPRAVITALTPILSSAGAALAVVGCHAR